MPLYRFPGALGGNAHSLVVVALAAAGREGVAEPMAIIFRYAVGNVRKRRRALVGGDHQIGVIAVPADDVSGRFDSGTGIIVGQVQEA